MSKFSKGDKVTWSLRNMPEYQDLEATVLEVVTEEDGTPAYYVIESEHGNVVAFDDEMEPEVENDCE